MPKQNDKCVTFLRKLVRKKVFTDDTLERTDLHRCLTTFDLVNLGVGSCICNGIYIVVGEVARNTAGPAVLLSFLVAGLASAVAAMCYAEFASRVPRAGSAYVYSYVTVGEFMAFVIGWNLLLEYIIGTASSARAWSMYFNSLIDDSIKDFFREYVPIHVYGFSAYLDFFSFGITLLMTALLAVGVRESARFNNIFTVINLLVIAYVVICGLFKAHLHNWELPPSQIPTHGAGDGGFFPYGISGMMAGAATCFYAYVGFDCIATTGEESKDPGKTIPVSIVSALVIIFVSYCSVAAVVTLMCPYYLIDVDTPVPFVFQYVGWDVARYIIAVGAICGLSTSLLGSMFPLPRVLYAMGSDGLIFRCMANISPRFKTPFIGTVTSGVFAGVLAMIFNMKELIEMMSIGTLLAYTLVAISVLILRYETDENLPNASNKKDITDSKLAQDEPFKLRHLVFPAACGEPTNTTATVTKSCVGVLYVVIIAFCTAVTFCDDALESREAWSVLLVVVLGVLVLLVLFCITRQPQNTTTLNFQVPCIPYVPAFSCLVNTYLMFKLNFLTWLRFGIWLIIGLLVYFLYGLKNATMNTYTEKEGSGGSDDKQGDHSSFPCRSTDTNSDADRYDSIGDTTP
ncbi:hypothetical protein V1264_007353 [Littorina saxatilis]|uniref:Cationic amino acid transporter C-terminal domain-containing protein n=1 Tax=Littorina saxatilis TaxID=31220 RepID=A0AAN9G365_9CAEN